MAIEQEGALLHELGVLHKTVGDIDVALMGTPENFGPPRSLNLRDLGDIVESREFFEARRQEVIKRLAGESLMAATHAA